jgi:hypothetical protein
MDQGVELAFACGGALEVKEAAEKVANRFRGTHQG